MASNLFNNFGFKDSILATLSDLNFTEPTLCQKYFYPLWSKHKNILCQSWTGSGKTHAFLVPIINKLNLTTNTTQAVIIVPTQELAAQIFSNCEPFGKRFLDLRVLNTGNNRRNYISNNQSQRHPHIIIGTPDKLLALSQKKEIVFTLASSLIIDECDMLFRYDFIDALDQILLMMNDKVQIGIFSATIQDNIRNWILKYIPNIQFLNVYPNQTTSDQIKHICVPLVHQNRALTLQYLLNFINPYFCLIFVNKQSEIKEIYELIASFKKKVAIIHGNLAVKVRIKLLKDIKAMKYQYLICTDLASRGLDIEGATHVVSYQIPNNLEFYIHRSGRCGRNNYEGTSYLLYNYNEEHKLNLLRQQNINFQKWKLTKNAFKPYNDYKKAWIKRSQNNNKTQAIIAKYKNQKVKPNYKSRRQKELSQWNKKKTLHK